MHIRTENDDRFTDLIGDSGVFINSPGDFGLGVQDIASALHLQGKAAPAMAQFPLWEGCG